MYVHLINGAWDAQPAHLRFERGAYIKIMTDVNVKHTPCLRWHTFWRSHLYCSRETGVWEGKPTLYSRVCLSMSSSSRLKFNSTDTALMSWNAWQEKQSAKFRRCVALRHGSYYGPGRLSPPPLWTTWTWGPHVWGTRSWSLWSRWGLRCWWQWCWKWSGLGPGTGLWWRMIGAPGRPSLPSPASLSVPPGPSPFPQIGRASCRGRV